MRNRSKRYIGLTKKIDKNKLYSLDEALKILKEMATTKFDETINLSIKLGIGSSKGGTQIRGAITLPKGTGKKIKILAIAEGEAVEEARNAGADLVGGGEVIKKIENGWTDFDSVVTTPDIMKKLTKVGKVLGPRGLMPSPRTGTVTSDLSKVIKELKGGRIEFRTDKFGNLHLPVGKGSFTTLDLKENILSSIKTMIREKPAHIKGSYLQKAYLSTSMGPSVGLDMKNLKDIVR